MEPDPAAMLHADAPTSECMRCGSPAVACWPNFGAKCGWRKATSRPPSLGAAIVWVADRLREPAQARS
eukprot:1802035-Prymnesium_polylepis.1